MEQGEVFYSARHKFEDGSISPKLLLLLNAPNKSSTCLFCLTTTKQRRRNAASGCHHDNSESYFTIEAKSDFFIDKTWILFSTIEEYTYSDVLTEHFRSNNLELKGKITNNLLGAILNCLKSSKDITKYQLKLIT